MKKIRSLKLNELSKRELDERELKELKGLRGSSECDAKCGTLEPTLGSTYGFWVSYFD